jgi:dCTP deaminase
MISRLKRKYPRWFIPNGLLSYNDLCVLVELGVINAPLNHVNGSSIDVTLDKFICVEDLNNGIDKIDLAKGESIKLTEPMELDSRGYMMPDTVLLASTAEWFDMPPWLSAEFSLKSSLGRSFLGHELAGWIDPCFSGKVTLELKNNTQFHKLILTAGMKIGQVKFFKHTPVPHSKSYAVRGQYNGQDKVQPSKGVK